MRRDELMHYGVGHDKGGHSGRYPWGSGDNPFQRDDFLKTVNTYKKQGFTERDIAEKMGITAKNREGEDVPSVARLRIQISLATDINRRKIVEKIEAMRDEGKSFTEIGKELGINESSVRSYLNKESKARMEQAENTAKFLKDRVDEKGMIYVGKGVNRELNVSEEKLSTALYLLELDGYEVYGGGIPQVTNPGKQINGKILCVPGTPHKDIYQFDKIGTVTDYESHDDGETFDPKYVYPAAIARDRVAIRYPKDGGRELDGTIEVRRGVEDLDLRGSNYAQVRVLMDNGMYLKGMAVYGKDEDFPKGVDIIFNTSKPDGTPESKVFKKIKTDDPENPFGALIKPGIYDPDDPESKPHGSGQGYYYDSKGNKKLSPINKTREEGDWDEWSKTLPSQFLAKQSKELCKRQLDLFEAEKYEEFEELNALTNPVIKKKMMLDFADTCDKCASTLEAASLPGQRYQVILPIPSLKDDEIYAPNYKDGDTVALVRFPHGGTFEIPILKVNNKNRDGKQVIGPTALDAVGINTNVAGRLSGADFDGDTVLIIPCNSANSKVKIKSSSPLKGLIDFDTKYEYPGVDDNLNLLPGVKKLMKDGQQTQTEMGKISNLITDMTLKGATEDELARAVRHSMVVIDAAKHRLDYMKSYSDNNIDELREKYLGHLEEDGKVHYGASTIISRAGKEIDVLKTVGSPKINPETGEYEWKRTDQTYIEKPVTYKDKNGKRRIKYDENGNMVTKLVKNTQKSTPMYETDDAYKLVSDLKNPIEKIYADHANYMKDLANKARLQTLDKNLGNQDYNPSAKKVYNEEFKTLEAKLALAEMNAPKEAKAQMMANAEIKKLKDKYKIADKELPSKDLKKYKQQFLTRARLKVGADSKGTKITLTDREWEAIQAGAITKTMLWKIINKMDKENLISRATPKKISNSLSSGQIRRLKAMRSSGYTIENIAEALGLSTATIRKYLKEGV